MRFLYSQYAVFKELSLLASDRFQLLKNSFRLSYFSLKPFSGKEIWYQRTPCMSRNWKTFSKKASKQLSTSSWTFRLSQFLQVPLNLQPDNRSIQFHPIDFYRAVSCKRIPWPTAAVRLQSLNRLSKQNLVSNSPKSVNQLKRSSLVVLRIKSLIDFHPRGSNQLLWLNNHQQLLPLTFHLNHETWHWTQDQSLRLSVPSHLDFLLLLGSIG